MRRGAIDLRWTTVALVCALTAAPALALDLGTAPETAAPPLTPEENAALENALLFDWTALNAAAPAKPLRLPSLSNDKGLDVSQTAKPDGARAVSVKQPLASKWDAKIGADLGLGPTDAERPDRLRANDAGGSGAAWATLGVPNIGSVDARVDPSKDQRKFGTTFKHSIPFGDKFAMTLQNTYSVTETYGAATGVADVPMMTLPPAAPAPTPQVWGNEKLAKFDMLPTGTTLAAGLATTSTDPVTHNKFSAEQKLYGPLHVTTAVTDLGQPVSNKSITAGFKLNW